jgi:hypothetical protein
LRRIAHLALHPQDRRIAHAAGDRRYVVQGVGRIGDRRTLDRLADGRIPVKPAARTASTKAVLQLQALAAGPGCPVHDQERKASRCHVASLSPADSRCAAYGPLLTAA